MKDDRYEPNPLMIALVGGAVGAAAALFFSDERRRTALKNMFSDLNARSAEIPEKVQQLATDLSKKAQDLTDRAGNDEPSQKAVRSTRKSSDSK